MAKTIDPGMRKSDRFIPWYFVLFFLVIFAVNGVFVYYAETTHSGVVTEKPYEHGLAYDKMIDEANAQAQGNIADKGHFKDGTLRWEITSKEDGAPVSATSVKVHMIRAVASGHDFDVTLTQGKDGVYAAPLDLPLQGAWTAKMEAELEDGKTYRATYRFITE
ncbi:MAG: FixH family protein [Alphaproteobacteria bacterium]|nr:FixH family protein [Alphaproteobacteria bacterium]